MVRLEVRCDPEDIIANRLDPWHGVHFHPYAFASLTVLDLDDDVVKVRVAKRLIGRVVAETDATFHSPEPRCIVMTIVEGEGKGSVVETHATPVEPGERWSSKRRSQPPTALAFATRGNCKTSSGPSSSAPHAASGSTMPLTRSAFTRSATNRQVNAQKTTTRSMVVWV